MFLFAAFQRQLVFRFRAGLLLPVFWLSLSTATAALSPAPDADLYYRRTHAGAWPLAAVKAADHSWETNDAAGTITVTAQAVTVGTNGASPSPRPQVLLDNNVDPANLGKGDWIWQMPATETRLGVSTVQDVINYEKSLGMQWITVKCGDGHSIWSQFTTDLVTRAHNSGLKVFGWAYTYGNNSYHYVTTGTANVGGEITVALNALALGADGLIIDAEIEYETNATRRADATLYASTIKSNYPTRFLAHAPFPYINSHSGFPYLEFGTNCDAVMPQDYWDAIGISPQTMVVNMNSQWHTWQNSLTGFNTNAIKPIVPLGQSYAPVTGAEITAFLLALQTNSPKATPAGYNGYSFWDAQDRNADMDAAILAATVGTNSQAPYISTPALDRMLDAGGTNGLAFTAGGTPPLAYQWQFAGTNLPGATNSTLTLRISQTNLTGNFTLVVTNAFGSVTSSPVPVLVYPPQAVVFADNFDTNSAAAWIVNKSSADTAIAFNYDYSALGIPSAPHSAGGTTRGVQMKANLTLGAVASLSISPTNQSFSGDYRLHCDMWINVNGPFPGGGASSTEFFTAGIGTSGTRTEWTGTLSDGVYFSADGDGGVSATSTTSGDYCAYLGSALQSTSSGIYFAGADTTVRDNANGYYTSAFPAGAAAPAWQQSAYTQQSGSLNSGTVGLGWHDVIVSRRGNIVDWSIDGVRLISITNVTFTASNICVGFWDPFASLTDNTNLSFGLVDNVRVESPAVAPQISIQPASVAVKLTTNASFTVTATGLPAPVYQWRFNGTNIVNATNASLTVVSPQTTNAGNYSVIVSNFLGAVTSTNAALAIIPPLPAQFQSATLLADGTLQLIFNGDSAWSYTVETSTNLAAWTTLTNLTSASGSFYVTTGAVTNGPCRFYRARSGP